MILQILVSNTRLAQAASGCAPSVDVLPIFDVKQQSVRNPARIGDQKTNPTCQQVKYGVQAVFGPSDPILGQHIHSICDALDIPHLEARLDLDTEAKEFSINLYPAQSLLNAAYQDIMEFLNWTKVAIIYEDDYGLVKLRELVRSPKSREIEVNLRQADPDSYRQVLSEMKSKEIRNLIVDTRPEHMHHFLRMILQLQMNDYKYHYLFTTFVSTLSGSRMGGEPDGSSPTRVDNRADLSVPVPGYRDLRPRGLQVQFRQYHCLPSGGRGGCRRAGHPEGHGAIPTVREYDPQQIESNTGRRNRERERFEKPLEALPRTHVPPNICVCVLRMFARSVIAQGSSIFASRHIRRVELIFIRRLRVCLLG
ncbi:hypothetical protein K0M31_005000 [Melipona bicolor]|uniref:Receptor ligand binding region domain-containing protein n=1 Tax=Melipona bicolor TaxID=60889 RepID=A0AA40FVY7_9HYME|nr:hypothetical protein K0M31_005000 [Melipona bicolor]